MKSAKPKKQLKASQSMKQRMLDPKELRLELDPRKLDFKTTNDIQHLTQFVGQENAVEGLHFGIGIQSKGYNLYAMGPPGVGKRSIIRTILEAEAQNKESADGWCYIHNFDHPQKPIAFSLPAGWGKKLQKDMENLLENLKTNIPIVFEGEEYHSQIQKLENNITRKQEKIFKKVAEDAKKEGLIILSTKEGFTIMPVDEMGEVLTAEATAKLSKKERKEKEKQVALFTEKIHSSGGR